VLREDVFHLFAPLRSERALPVLYFRNPPGMDTLRQIDVRSQPML